MPSPLKNQPFLLLDASSMTTQIGILLNSRWLAFAQSKREAIDGIFMGARDCLKVAGLTLREVRGFLFCEGPGSVLGIRLTAMAVNTWSRPSRRGTLPIYAYGSLKMAAALMQAEGIAPPFTLISDYRKDLWNALSLSANGESIDFGPVEAVELSRLKGALYHLPQRKSWRSPPAKAIPLPYSLKRFPDLPEEEKLLRPVARADVFQRMENTYKRWNRERHR